MIIYHQNKLINILQYQRKNNNKSLFMIYIK